MQLGEISHRDPGHILTKESWLKSWYLNGPNLNLLGAREPEHYGTVTLEAINQRLTALGEAAGHRVSFYQSNAEHELVGRVQQAIKDKVAFILLNPAAFTHTSVACATRWRRRISRSSRCTCRTCTRARHSATTPIFPISPPA